MAVPVEIAENMTLDQEINNSLMQVKNDDIISTSGNLQDCLLYKFIINSIVIGTLCLVGIVGNLLAFTVFQLDTLKTSTTFLFQGLSLIDTLLLMTVFPLYFFESFVLYMDTWKYYTYNIQAYLLVYLYPCSMIAQTATIYVTVLVAVNRYIAVCMPYKAARLCNVSKARRYLAAVMLFSFLYNIPRFFVAKVQTKYHEYNGTDPANATTINSKTWSYYSADYTPLGKSDLYNIIYNNIFYTIFLLAIPLLILTILNILLIITLKDVKKKRAVMQTRAQQQDNNVTLVLIIVILVFTVCQTPALINQILWNALVDEYRECGKFQFYFKVLCNLMVVVNSAVNFVIYFAFNSRFKQVVLQRICGMETDAERAKRRASANGTTCSQTLLTKM